MRNTWPIALLALAALLPAPALAAGCFPVARMDVTPSPPLTLRLAADTPAPMADDPTAVRAFQQHYGLTFPILLDESGKVNRTYGVSALPTTFFIGPDGQIREIVVGGPISEAALEARIRTLLPAGGP